MDIFSPDPLSAQILPSWDTQAVDITWRASAAQGVIGYHIWRAQGAPSNFKQITDQPLQTTFFRDLTRLVQVTEKPTRWVSPPDSASHLTGIRASQTPMSKSILDSINRPILATLGDVKVISDYDPNQPYQISKVDPNTGLILFGHKPIINEAFDNYQAVPEPTELESLTLTYFVVDRFTDSTFSKDLFYKVVEVFSNGTLGSLDSYPAISNQELDPSDIFWREAMRRNRFIFEQVGEPAYVILRKVTGPLCPCVDHDTLKSRNDCPLCWGVGYAGGYDGPYPITFTPPNATGQIKQTADGRAKSRTAQSFLGPTPILNSGDIIFRYNGERLVINDVERTTVRGTSLQQTYNTELLKPSDFRNRIAITNPNYPVILLSTSLPVFENKDHDFGDPIPANISLSEGISSVVISDPTKDPTKTESGFPDDMRTNTKPSVSPIFNNWSL